MYLDDNGDLWTQPCSLDLILDSFYYSGLSLKKILDIQAVHNFRYHIIKMSLHTLNLIEMGVARLSGV